MGLRFRKKIKLFQGVAINLSKSGASLSVGRPGATVNLNKDGYRGTVGLPGSGFSYQTRRAKWKQAEPLSHQLQQPGDQDVSRDAQSTSEGNGQYQPSTDRTPAQMQQLYRFRAVLIVAPFYFLILFIIYILS